MKRNKLLVLQCARIVLITVIVISAVLLVYLLNSQGFARITRLNMKGDYRVIEQEQIPHEHVSEFFVENGQIYVFYDKTGLVNVYSETGTFQYGILFCTNPQNGIGDIAYLNGYLYINSRFPMVYTFDGQTCTNCFIYEYQVNTEEYHRLQKLFDTVNGTQWDGYQYTLAANNAGILRQREGGPAELIVEFPRLHSGVHAVEFILLGACLLLLLLDRVMRDKLT